MMRQWLKTRKINDFILNLSGLSGRKFRSMLNNLIEKYESPRYLEVGSWHGSNGLFSMLPK